MTENFRDKYTKSGRIGQRLIDGFYADLNRLLGCAVGDGQRVLEVGMGEGFSTQRIAEFLTQRCHFEASEYDEKLMRKAAARNPGLVVSQESVYEMARQDKSFDVVICLEVLEHLDRPDVALEELRRVARQYVIVSVPREPIWRMLNMLRGKYIGNLGNTPGHIQHWSARTLKEYVSPLFEVVAERRPLPWTMLLLRPKG